MRIVIISNRLPFTVRVHDTGPEYRRSEGGLATGLWSFLEQRAIDSPGSPDFLWIGWPGMEVPPEQQDAVEMHGRLEFKAVPVFVPEARMERFYHGFCNRTIWPLFHYFPSITRYEEDYWQEYREVNQLFGEAVLRVLQPDDVVWIQDYHLMLLPGIVREHFPQMPIGFFLHVPFPSFEVFRLLPRAWREGLIEGLLGSSLIGFHTHEYTRDFLSSVLRTCGYEHQLGRLTLRDRVVKVDTFPMGIDFERFARAAVAPETMTRVAELQQQCAGMKVIFSVDRLDYSKGLLNRLRGYDLFLKRHPEWRRKVVFVISVAPSRIGVESYRTMKQDLEQAVGRITGAHGDVQWAPLMYQYRNVDFEELVALYRFCDVALITPLRDGMNLVAKEFIASRSDQRGVLVLSEMAGAAKEMGEALIINPFHAEEFAEALATALTMPEEEQIRRNRLLQDRLRRYDVKRWGYEFVQTLVAAQKTEAARSTRWLTGKAQVSMMQQFHAANRRALLLDYDGTLVPYSLNPMLAKPDQEVLELLAALAGEPRNNVVLVSGRSRQDLESWFGALPLSLIAEHGVWLRRRGKDWLQLKTISTDWKDRVRPILQLYVDRLPGALLEEKEFSLVWHYRAADPEQGPQRAKELLDALADYTRNVEVQVLEGNKVLEIRNTGVSKGTAAREWLGNESWDFTLGIGDDWTDETLFRELPPAAFSVRVGLTAQTAARYYLGSHSAVRRILRSLLESARGKTSVNGLFKGQAGAGADAPVPVSAGGRNSAKPLRLGAPARLGPAAEQGEIGPSPVTSRETAADI
jgi:trehalose 6-phosphate synthase/phosphatase